MLYFDDIYNFDWKKQNCSSATYIKHRGSRPTGASQKFQLVDKYYLQIFARR
jgi:hypothetical protein